MRRRSWSEIYQETLDALEESENKMSSKQENFRVASGTFELLPDAEVAAKKRAADQGEDIIIWQAHSVAKAVVPQIDIVKL